MDDELQLSLVGLGLTLDPCEAVGRKAIEERLVDGPHAPRKLAGPVGHKASQIGLVLPCATELRVGDCEDAFDALGGREVGDVASVSGSRWCHRQG